MPSVSHNLLGKYPIAELSSLFQSANNCLSCMPVLSSLDSLTTAVWLVVDLFVQVGLVICFHRESLV